MICEETGDEPMGWRRIFILGLSVNMRFFTER